MTAALLASALLPASSALAASTQPVISPTVAAAPVAAPAALPPTTCGTAGCAVTVAAFAPAFPDADPNIAAGLGQGAALATFTYIVNVDNTKLPTGPQLQQNGIAPTESFSPLIAVGDQARPTINLRDGRYLISVRSPDRKMWGRQVTLPNDANADGTLAANVVLTEQSLAKPLPLGSIKIYVFRDDQWTNGAPDLIEGGLAGFKVELYEQTNSIVTVDYHNFPLCDPAHVKVGAPAPGSWAGCLTDTDGFIEIDNLGPATYFAEVMPPAGPCNSDPNSAWYQTSTIDGGFKIGIGTEEGAPGSGSPTALAVDVIGNNPAKRTINTFGFVCSPKDFATPGTGEITGTARTLVSWADNVNTFGQPVANPFVALSSAATDQTIYVGRGDAGGNFDILNVPAGSYMVSFWDEQLSSIFSFVPVTVAAGAIVDMNTSDPFAERGVGIPRWFGWTSGTVYKDLNKNGVWDAGEPVVPNTDMDQRWRDGSIKESTFTDPNGRYEYPTAEGGPVGKWIINEQGFARFGVSGASVHDEKTGAVTQIPSDLGGALLVNVLDNPGHRTEIDWGKYDYAPGEAGQIVGITYWATTRNEFHANLQKHEDYEPAIPDVLVYLEGPGPDGLPNTADDTILNKYVTDHWQQPGVCPGVHGGYDPAALPTPRCADGTTPAAPRTDMTTVPAGGSYSEACSMTASNGTDLSASYNPLLTKNCMELPYGASQVKDGAFDGGFAFADYCPNGFDEAAPDPNMPCFSDPGHNATARVAPAPLAPGTYITHAVMPKDLADTRDCNLPGDVRVSTAKGGIAGGGAGCIYRIVREGDVNVDLGNQFTPAIPEPPCVGDDHIIDQSTLTPRSPFYGVAGAHAPLCDKHLVVLTAGQNANADFHMMTNFKSVIDVQAPGRLIGWALNDLVFDTNPNSLTFTGNAPVPNIPVGVYHRYDTDPNHWRWFTTVTTSALGTYEVLLPSTETFNCPIPQGPCPGMYRLVVNDPGTKARPNANYDMTFLPGSDYIVDIWPGLTTQLDSPLIPISEFGCETPFARPEIFQVSRPWVRPGLATDNRRITIQGSFAGAATQNVVQLTGRAAQPTVNLTPANGGIVSWTVTQIVIQLPANIPVGQYQLAIIVAGGARTVNGLTVHVLGGAYNPNLVTVGPPDPAFPYRIQDAVDAAPAGSLIVLGAGVYTENIVLWKPVKLQGLGIGGTIGARNVQPPAARFLVTGSVIDGRFSAQNQAHWNSVVAAHPLVGTNLPSGADITVGAQSATAYDISPANVQLAARIDGVGLTGAHANGAGGILLQQSVNNLQITNNALELNGGVFAGGIGIGQPDHANSNNHATAILNDLIIGNGGIVRSGGVGIFSGADGYEIANSLVCGNESAEYGAGISHWGFSPNGRIHDNEIIYNESVDSGAGISIQTAANANPALIAGSGSVIIERNRIEVNFTGDDGGGIFVLEALTASIDIRNNIITNNVAADLGGAIMLDDSTNVRIVNNTIANNVTTASSAVSLVGVPHGAGLTSEATNPALGLQGTFSNPVALFNNIFWHNQAYTLSYIGPGATLISQGYIDFEIHGTLNPTTDTFTPRYSDLTDGLLLGPDGVKRPVPAGQGNTSGDPNFIAPFQTELVVGVSRLNPRAVSVRPSLAQLLGEIVGDYHLVRPTTRAQITASFVIDRGVRCSNTPVPAPANEAITACSGAAIQAPFIDFDGQFRPQLLLLTPLFPATRYQTPWDLGADELTTVVGAAAPAGFAFTPAGAAGAGFAPAGGAFVLAGNGSLRFRGDFPWSEQEDRTGERE